MKSTHMLMISHCKIIDFLRINTKLEGAFKLAFQEIHSIIK